MDDLSTLELPVLRQRYREATTIMHEAKLALKTDREAAGKRMDAVEVKQAIAAELKRRGHAIREENDKPRVTRGAQTIQLPGRLQ